MAHGDVAGGLPSAQVTATGGWVCFEDEAGAWLNGPIRRTWGKAGQTPVLRLSGKRNDKISMVAWICFKEGTEPRMIYAVKPSGGYTKKDFPRFLALLHRRLDGPVTLVWDNYSSHISKHVKQYAQRQDWLTIIQMPSYAPELNPVELLWAHAKEKIANRAFRSISELHRAVKRALRYIQRHPELLIGFLAGTGLELTPPASSP
ncbi:IS630 family transposase [Streptomyces sp. NBC_01264]|uniref:IS630 family transposase n=1 Tax=Streptomyces sp. NBC_01264 TaxID=2903804 RepID=UPI00224D3A41|nr:IS630 family transposase [Streptomyces sp. NBC_01264]MCX4784244.1 IS630 family transposase [Streptomyces sp. NBC_01264]MCX4784505.1 IS630 family transposase [Streptomyces sp. NBC_01264]